MVDLRRGRIYLTLDEKSFCARPTRLALRGQDVFVLGEDSAEIPLKTPQKT